MRLFNRKLRIWHRDYLLNRYLWRNIESAVNAVLLKKQASPPLVLDIGCGHKPYADLFKSCQYVGINISTIDATPDVLGDARSLPFRSGVADVVFCTQVIEHLSEPILLLEEIKRVLKSDGVLLLTAPFNWPLHEEPHDYYRFTCYGLEWLLSNSGFRNIDIIPDGGDWVQIICNVNLKLDMKLLAPLRVPFNLFGLFLNFLSPGGKSPLNYTVTAEK